MTDSDFTMMVRASRLLHGTSALATLLRVSLPTIDRWARGKNLPHDALRPSVKKALDEYSEFNGSVK